METHVRRGSDDEPPGKARLDALQRAARWTGAAALLAAVAVFAFWLATVWLAARAVAAGVAPASAAPAVLPGVARAVILAAPLLAVLWALLRLAAAIASGGADRRRAVALAALLVVALALRFVGLGHELVDRPYLDEGTYYHHATEIDRGLVFRPTFVYPHLVYYADAVILWAAELFRQPLTDLLSPRLGPDAGWLEVQWLLLRLLPALLGALVVWPVFRAAETLVAAGSEKVPGTLPGRVPREAKKAPGTTPVQVPGTTPGKVPGTGAVPLLAGVLAGLAMAGAPLWNEISHLNISDLPAAFFAAVCFAATAGLLRRETTRGYLIAGVAGGLAAVSKYPAGVVVLALAAVWLRHRLATRRWSWGLLWAALAAMALFAAAMPSLFVFPQQALFGDRGVLFGVRQYAGGGWIGVQPHSFVLYYADLVRDELGLPLLLTAAAGLFCLGADERRRLAWMLPFPVAYLGLMVAMSMVVQRNLLPVVPALAVLAGVAAAAALHTAGRVVRRRWSEKAPSRAIPRWAAPAAIALAVVALVALPARRSLDASLAMAAPSTRELARAWIADHVPPGSALLVESYGPRLSPGRYAVWNPRFAARVPLSEARTAGVDVIVLASAAYARFLDPAQHSQPQHAVYADWYRHAFDELPRLAEFSPEGRRWGPVIRVLRLPPPAPTRRPRRVPAAELFVPDAGMAADDPMQAVFFLPGQWCSVRLDLAAGRYRVHLRATIPLDGPLSGHWRLVNDAGQPRGEGAVVDGEAEVAMTEPGRALLYLYLAEGARLRAVDVTPFRPPPGDSVP